MRILGQRSTTISLLLGMLAVLAVACQAEGTPTPGDAGGTRAQPTREAGLPTATPSQSVDSPQTAFTLTILYTGEVYGEILPCPG